MVKAQESGGLLSSEMRYKLLFGSTGAGGGNDERGNKLLSRGNKTEWEWYVLFVK